MAGCVFCAIMDGHLPASTVYADARCVAFMDLFPLRPGHVLVAPRDHHAGLAELPAEQRDALMATGVRIAAALPPAGFPGDGVNYVINDGRAAQQTVDHVHLHVLPRSSGDFWRLIATMARRLTPLPGGAAPRARLDDQAGRIRAQLDA